MKAWWICHVAFWGFNLGYDVETEKFWWGILSLIMLLMALMFSLCLDDKQKAGNNNES